MLGCIEPGIVGKPPIQPCHPTPSYMQSYHETQEDYVAAVYYDVGTAAAVYFGNDQNPVNSGETIDNPSAGGYLKEQSPAVGMWSEETNHYLIAFFVAGLGYYDPFGYSEYTCNECGDGNSYWFYFESNLYIFSQTILLGETIANTLSQPTKSYDPPILPSQVSVLYQSYIPPTLISGPPDANCPAAISYDYEGDERTAPNPSGFGSYRTMQATTLTPSAPNGSLPGSTVWDTGPTIQFDTDVESILIPAGNTTNGVIPAKAYDVLRDCHWRNNVGQANPSTVSLSDGINSGGSDTVDMTGYARNPLVIPQAASGPITWSFNVTVTPENKPFSGGGVNGINYVHYSIPYRHTCYPAHELDMNGSNIYKYSPSSNSLPYVTSCLLLGLNQLSGTVTGDLYVSSKPHLP